MKTLFSIGKLLPLKVGLLFVLASLSFSAFAHYNNCGCCDCVYVGNPTRPYTVWIPEHCRNRCYVPGHYVKYINPPVCCKNVYWNCDHWQPTNVAYVGDTDSGL